MQFVPFQAQHLQQIELSAGERALYAHLFNDPGQIKALLEPDLAFSAALEDGRIGGAGGIIRLGHRGHCWLILGKMPPTAWTAVVRRSFEGILTAHARGIRRLEATVDAEFWQGMRLMHLLGFTSEGLLKGYGPNGRDHITYARLAP